MNLNMTDEEKQEYLDYENRVLEKVDLGLLSMYEAAKLIDEYLKSQGL